MDPGSPLESEYRRLTELLDAGVRDRLLAVPGVFHTAVGLREVAGRATDELCLKTWVHAKAAPKDVPPGALVPRVLAGAATDVSEVPPIEFTEPRDQTLRYRTHHRPLLGGVQISNGYRNIDDNGALLPPGGGTLGCFGTRVKDGKKVLLTCWHVAFSNYADKGALLYQPGADLDVAHFDDLYPKKPTSTAHRIGPILDCEISERVDAAIVEVCSCHVLCFNFGVGFRNRILGLDLDGDTVEGVSTALRPTDPVWKVGRISGRTQGKVVTLDYPSFTVPRFGVPRTFTGQIQIEGVGEIFSERGDSGAVVVDRQRKVVGLLFARMAPLSGTGPVFGLANHIADVTAKLGITIEGGERSLTDDTPDLSPDQFDQFAARLRATPAGQRLTAAATAHREEIQALIRGERRVTVAWHRAQGPAWAAALLRGARHPGYRLPDRIDGITRAEALTRLRDALDQYGSPALRADLAHWYPPLLAAFTRGHTTRALLDEVGGPA
ncbi:hypothetical protein AB0D49_36315 [Streptomyces sp. NPDC048290]|uniref:hypothetical protein n=1 Tax=Streptomyces sp. NPDC048290 TaxID=3155811 RepID=UPI00343EBA75